MNLLLDGILMPCRTERLKTAESKSTALTTDYVIANISVISSHLKLDELDGPQQQTVNQYFYTRKVHFGEMLSVNATFEQMTFKMSPVSFGPENE